jgi:ferredoxin-NADP reductase
MSMLRHAISREPSRSVTLIYSVRTEADIAFRDELRGIARRNPRVRVVVAVTRGGENPEYFPGRIDENLLRSVAAAPLESLYFVCGPKPMIDSMKQMLSRAGIAEARVHAEAFEAAVAWASKTAASSGSAARRLVSGGPARGESFRMRLARSARAIDVAPGQTLLEAAEQAGANIEFSCRSGVCGTCRTRLVRGDVEDEGALDRSERDEGWILPCVATARGDCELDA